MLSHPLQAGFISEQLECLSECLKKKKRITSQIRTLSVMPIFIKYSESTDGRYGSIQI